MKKLTIVAACVAGLFGSAAFAQSITAGNATGAPGTIAQPSPVPVTFTRNAATPVADYSARISYDTTQLDITVAAANGGNCTVNDALGLISLQPPPGQSDLATNVYCNLTVTVAAGATNPGSVTLDVRTDFAGGGCFDAAAAPVNCTLNDGTITVGAPAGVPPTLTYMPPPGSSVVFPGSGGQLLNATIAVTGTGGSGTGAAATARVTNCQVSPPFSPPIFSCTPAGGTNHLDFTPGGADPGDIQCACQAPVVGVATASLTCEEIRPLSAGVAVIRSWNLTCPGTAGQCGVLSFAPPEGVVPFSAGSASIVVTHAGGTTGVNTTFNGCALGGANAGNFSITNSPISFNFPGGSSNQGTISLACNNATTVDVTATLSCNQICDNTTTARNWTLSCPGQTEPPPSEEAIPVPTMGDMSRILMAALLLLIGMGAVTLRSRG